MKSPVLFDFDGTLAYTEDLIIESYILAGAPETLTLLTNVLELSWKEWLEPEVGPIDAHAIWRRKNKIYARLIEQVPLVHEMCYLAAELDKVGHLVGVLTGAPLVAEAAIYDRLSAIFRPRLLICGAAGAAKIQVMRALGPGGSYVDDQTDLKDDILAVGWSYVNAHEDIDAIRQAVTS